MHGFSDKPGQGHAGDERGTAEARDEEHLLTESEAQLATTLALMTGFSHGCCAAHKASMAGRVAEQLALLAQAQSHSSDMHAFLQRLSQRWLHTAADLTQEPQSSHWHAPTQTLQ